MQWKPLLALCTPTKAPIDFIQTSVSGKSLISFHSYK